MTNGVESHDPAWLERIADSLAGIQYGSVEVVIHEGKIVQIERKEKDALAKENLRL